MNPLFLLLPAAGIVFLASRKRAAAQTLDLAPAPAPVPPAAKPSSGLGTLVGVLGIAGIAIAAISNDPGVKGKTLNADARAGRCFKRGATWWYPYSGIDCRTLTEEAKTQLVTSGACAWKKRKYVMGIAC